MKNKQTYFSILYGTISAESGIPTFRDADGLWEKYDIEKICNFQTWQDNYNLVHNFYNERRIQLGNVHPNLTHTTISNWENKYKVEHYAQNIDDLLERGGCKNVTHLHGFLTEMKCCSCGSVWDIGYTAWNKESFCNECKSQFKSIKPNVVFFGEHAPNYQFLMMGLLGMKEEDYLIIMGTSGTVLNINGFVKHYASRCKKILNNLTPSDDIDSSLFDHTFFMKSSEAVIEIEKILDKNL